MATKQPKNTGRPKAQPKVNVESLIKKWAKVQLPKTDLCKLLDISVDTFDNNPVYRDLFSKAKEGGRAALRAKQMQLALAGDKTMLVWLGKQYLGQKETQAVELSGPNQGPISIDDTRKAIDSKLSCIASRIATEEVPRQSDND